MELAFVKKYYSALIAIISSTTVLGGGFYAWGVFENRLSQLEQREYVVEQTVDLQPVYEKIDEVQNGLIARQDGFLDKIDSAKDVLINRQSEKVREINTAIATLKSELSETHTIVSVNTKELELLKLEIEEIELNNSNPLR
jgi:phage anti-repressor protein